MTSIGFTFRFAPFAASAATGLWGIQSQIRALDTRRMSNPERSFTRRVSCSRQLRSTWVSTAPSSRRTSGPGRRSRRSPPLAGSPSKGSRRRCRRCEDQAGRGRRGREDHRRRGTDEAGSGAEACRPPRQRQAGRQGGTPRESAAAEARAETYIGVTPEALAAELKSKSLAQVAIAHSKTVAGLKEA